ncbi:ribonuclease S-2-like [Tripterygium wilfordii]|nr:ribonuclease S-2-like [Tripterygium wilfordii]XP_038693667.1 ribonuclease S-2-like [Tripterygium wilfordii]XP_038693669.1 ribonuclease S-2-like [Tripterygium wilfordii]
MARRLSIGKTIICLLAIIVISLVLDTKARMHRRYQFFKIAVKWPTSYCNTGHFSCQGPIVVNFTIHGLFPMYFPNTIVPPYDEDSGCTDITPMNEDDIDLDYLRSILDEMNMYWLDVVYDNWVRMNLALWRRQFWRHGKCFDYPDHPLYHFNIALDFIRRVNLLQILDDVLSSTIKCDGLGRNKAVRARARITPRNREGYLASYIAGNISRAGRKRVQIRCNEDAHKVLQLFEVVICFEPNGVAIPCAHGYIDCTENDMINFPLP